MTKEEIPLPKGEIALTIGIRFERDGVQQLRAIDCHFDEQEFATLPIDEMDRRFLHPYLTVLRNALDERTDKSA